MESPGNWNDSAPLVSTKTANTAQHLLVAMGGMSAVAGVLEPHVPNPGSPFSPVFTGYTLVMSVLFFFWCRADAAARGIRPPPAAPLIVALIAIVGVPYYYMKVLPLSRALIAIGKAALFSLLLGVINAACLYLSTQLSGLPHA